MFFVRHGKKNKKKTGWIHIRSIFIYAFFSKYFRYFSPKFMSLFILTASATKTATAMVTIKPKTITFSFL